MRNKLSYREYGLIYTEQCPFCFREGSPYCKLEYDEGRCVNFKSLEDLKKKL